MSEVDGAAVAETAAKVRSVANGTLSLSDGLQWVNCSYKQNGFRDKLDLETRDLFDRFTGILVGWSNATTTEDDAQEVIFRLYFTYHALRE